jgi:hypothetical protein
MNTEDKIYKKIQQASEKGEKDFLSVDKLWNRVEEKLDTQVIIKKKNTWQKIAVAASIALLGTLIYIFTLEKENLTKEQNVPKVDSNEIIVSTDSTEKLIRKVKENVTLETQKDKKSNTEILSNAYSEFSTSKIEKQVEASKINLEPSKDVYLNLNSTINNFSNMASTNNNYILKGKVFDAIEVNMNQNVNYELKETDKKIEIPTSPLLVIDGKVIKNKYSNDNIEASIEQINEDEDVETVIVLKEPLYIINGMEYTEESLFGKNPTSPYAPLNKQKIKSVEVLQAPEAQARFGEKGKKGVVIITTKNGKFTKKVLN